MLSGYNIIALEGTLMGGGRFEYSERYLEEIAIQIEQDIKYNSVPHDIYNSVDTVHGYQLTPDSIFYMKKMISDLKNMNALLKSYDYIVSGDSEEKQFLEKAKDYYRE